MSQRHILVIEDDENIQELVKYNLEKEGFKVTCAGTGEDGIQSFRASKPDIVLLDLMLPGMDGLTICRQIRADKSNRETGIIILTAKGEESDIVVGLELGADDYVTKPFSPKVLLARIRAVLRRREESEGKETATKQGVVEINEIVIHTGRHEVLVKGTNVELTATEFDLLHFLASHPGWVFTRSQIIDAVRGDDVIITDRAVDVQIVGLRKKLGEAGILIETVRGVGYRFKEI